MILKVRNMQKLSENDNVYQRCGDISKKYHQRSRLYRTAYIVYILCTVQTAFNCLNSSVYAYIYY